MKRKREVVTGGFPPNLCPDCYQVLSSQNSANRSECDTIVDKLDGIIITGVDENTRGETLRIGGIRVSAGPKGAPCQFRRKILRECTIAVGSLTKAKEYIER